MSEAETSLDQASWIWANVSAPHVDSYVCFRRSFFHISRAELEVVLDLSCDSDFVAWLNGIEVTRGQFSDFAQSKTWNRFPVGPALRRGRNLLAILVFHRGENFFDCQAGRAGLIASLRLRDRTIQTGGEGSGQWRALLHPAFRSGRKEKVTAQFGFTFEYDARKDTDWISPAFSDHKWPFAVIVQKNGIGAYWMELQRRPLPSLVVGELQQVRMVAQGIFRRSTEDGSASAAIVMSNTALCSRSPSSVFQGERHQDVKYEGPPPDPVRFLSPGSNEPLKLRKPAPEANGCYFIIDFGVEVVGLLEFEAAAEAGTIIEIAHGEHLDDGRTWARIGERNFADRYICRRGRQKFQMPFRRIGARFLEVHVSGYTAIQFYSFSLRKVEYPSHKKGGFQTSDAMANRLQAISVRTLELCRHDHYEDCPWREQSLYAYDARLQALYGYYAFGDYRFSEISLSLLGRNVSPEGFVALTAPSNTELNIPIFSFAWITALAEHWLYSGTPALFDAHQGIIALILNNAFKRLDARTGLYHPPTGREFWHFYEWSSGLSGSLGNERLNGVHHAGYNLYLHEAGRAWAWMLEEKGATAQADTLNLRLTDLRTRIHQNFWDEPTGMYRSVLFPNGKRSGAHELIQALALCENVSPAKTIKKLRKTLGRQDLQPCTLASAYYLLCASMKLPTSDRMAVLQRLLKSWEHMVFSGATTMWETATGARDFEFAGSLCHGWSALPVYYHASFILGVQPLSPGYRSFAINPLNCNSIEAEGKIPTPFGAITIRRSMTKDGWNIVATGPRKCKPKGLPGSVLGFEAIAYNGVSLLGRAN